MAAVLIALALLPAASAEAKKPPKSATTGPEAVQPAPEKVAKAPKVKKVKPPAKPADTPETQEQKQQIKAQKKLDHQVAQREKAAVKQQAKAEKQEAKNKKKEGNKEAPPQQAPASNSAPPAGTPVSQTGSTPTAGPGSNGSGTGTNGTGNNGGNNNDTGSGNSNDRKNGSGNDRGKSKSNSGGGSGGEQVAATVGTGGVAGAAIAGPPNDGSGNDAAGKDSDGDSKSSTQKRPPPTIVERVIHEIPTSFRIALAGLLALVALLSGISVRERRRSIRTERDMMIDGLTGVGSRKALTRQLDTEWKRSVRHDRPLGVLLLDLDDLKEINDSFGHAAGDELLRSASHSISERVRQSDMVARLGGDEFVVVCPETEAAGLEQLALALQQDFKRLKVGVSVGFAERMELDRNPDDLLARADQAMYAQKRAGAVG